MPTIPAKQLREIASQLLQGAGASAEEAINHLPALHGRKSCRTRLARHYRDSRLHRSDKTGPHCTGRSLRDRPRNQRHHGHQR